MTFERNQVASSGQTDAQIEEKLAGYIRGANEALASVRDKDARWSSYSPSHSTFEMLVGEPYAADNVVLSIPACEYLAGPVQWSAQRLEVLWRCSSESPDRDWEFEIRDEGVGFRAVGSVFRWRRGYDLWAHGGLWIGRGGGPEDPLSCEQAEKALTNLLQHFYKGSMGHNDLRSEVERILDRLPVVKTRPGLGGDNRSD